MWMDEDTGEYLNGGESNGGTDLAHEQRATLGLVRGPEDGSTMALMVQAAQGLVRDPAKLIQRAKQVGGLLAGNGFYRFPAGGSTVEGPSIDMAEALAQEWGAIIYQVRIVHAESLASGGQRVHLRASVADMRSLVCAEVDQVVTTSAPPGKFADKVEQRERWHGMQIQSAASKIVRNAILRVLPSWYVEPAFQAAKAVDSKAALNGKTLPEARAGAAQALKELGCAREELEQYLGHPLEMWAVPQISSLKELYRALNTGAQSIEAWRAALAPKTAEPTAPRKSALGLPATTEAKPLETHAPQQKEQANAKGKKGGGEELLTRQPGEEG